MTTIDITEFVTFPFKIWLEFGAKHFTLFGIDLELSQWWLMALIFGLILRLLSWLAGSDYIFKLLTGRNKSD